MQAKAEIEDTKNLYDYWGERLYRLVLDDSRILRHKETMQILLNSGADRSIIFHIYMKWCVRESVYCIILMPVILIVDAMIIRKAA